jgi:DNA-binding NarL/FixJ family response regulator
VRTKVSQQGIARETILLKCPYPLVTLGLKQVLGAAGYEVRSGLKGPPLVGESPSVVIYSPDNEDLGEGVAQEVKSLRALVPKACIMILGFSSSNLPLARAALRAGARGFLYLGMQPSQIARALRLACEGEVVFPRELTTGLLKEEKEKYFNILALTARQREILELMGEGLTNAEIARRLFLAEGTVKQHLRATYKLLEVRSRNQAAKLLRTHNRAGITRNTQQASLSPGPNA